MTKKKLNKAQQKLVEDHIRFAYWSVNRLKRSKWLPAMLLDKDELESAALLGLCRAALKFDPERGKQFSTYAAYCIRSVVVMSAIHSQVIRFPTTQFDGRKFKSCIFALRMSDLHISDLEKLEKEHNEPEPGNEQREYLNRLLSLLDDRSIQVLRAVYWDKVSMSKLSNQMNLSKEGVRQIVQRAVKKIRRYIEGTENKGKLNDAE